MTNHINPETQQRQTDLLESVHHTKATKAGRAGRAHQMPLSAAADARAKVGMSQSEFAQLLGVSMRTLQNWEQGRSTPSGAARTLIKVALHSPQTLREVAAGA